MTTAVELDLLVFLGACWHYYHDQTLMMSTILPFSHTKIFECVWSNQVLYKDANLSQLYGWPRPNQRR